MRTLTNLVKRAVLWLDLYSLNIEISDKEKLVRSLPAEQSYSLRFTIDCLKKLRATCRADYIATFPPGKRRTWEAA